MSLPRQLSGFLSAWRQPPDAFRFAVSSWLLVFLALTCAACKSGYPAAERQNRAGEERGGAAPRQVKTARVVEMAMGRSVTVSGTLAAYDQATLSAKVPGRLRSISVDLGSVVRRGQMIAQLDEAV